MESLKLPSDFVLFDKAEEVLREFGGLRIGSTGNGITCAKSDIEFMPEWAEGLSEVTKGFGTGEKVMFPLGEFHRKNGILFIEQSGEIYVLFDGLELFSGSLDRALVELLLGLKSGGLAPDEASE